MRWAFFILFFSAIPSYAQDISGKWKGKISNNEYLELDIRSQGRFYAGTSYDYEFSDSSDYCRAIFDAEYYKSRRQLYLNGVRFIENSNLNNKPHVLMTMYLFYRRQGKKEFLEGIVINQESPGDLPDSVWLEKNNSTATVQTTNEKPDTNTYNIAEREKVWQETFIVSSGRIKLKLFDNEIFDADTVSLFMNNKPILLKQELSYKPIYIDILLTKQEPLAEITMFAENLGSIPPNTAMLQIITDKEYYSLKLSSDLTKSAGIRIQLKPE